MPGEIGKVRELLLEDEMKNSYLTYAMSVIVSRALPDVRDGLKPSQRRVLVAMNDLGLGPRAKYRKCAKIAGDTSGNYHPHGEAVVYPTLVRLAQDFNLRYTLVDGQGNFGSVDGDPPAAMRYTEARMTAPAMDMLADLEYETVDFVRNYDDTRDEPVVLPSKFPNLLCNGALGIAVGMATSIPPHNLNEVCDALIKLIENPEITIDEILEVLPGPDFPTGGLICGRRGIREAYATGRGQLLCRAKLHVEELKGGRKAIVVTELLYQVNKAELCKKIAEDSREGRIEGLSGEPRDESNREGTRIVIELKRGEDENVIINQLYKHTQLQDSFSYNLLAIVDGEPRTLNIKQFLEAYRDYRMEVIRRRTRFLLKRAEERAHILEGLRIALANIDEVIALIKASASVPDARSGLMIRFLLSERQADAILEMRLQRLTHLEVEKLEEEYRKVQEEIRNYKAILTDENLVLDIIREDLYELKEKYGDARRSHFTDEVEDIGIEDLIQEETMTVTISHAGYIKRMSPAAYRKQNRGGVGVTGGETKEGDFLEHIFTALTHDYILFFTSDGKVRWLKVYDVPQLGRTSMGRWLVNILELPEGVQLSAMVPVRLFDGRMLVMATERGVIKKTPLTAFGNPKRGGIIAIRIDEGDRLIGVRLTNGNNEIMLGTRNGIAIRFHESKVRAMGRVARGVRGVSLREGDRVVDMVLVAPGTSVLTICEKGFGKRTDFGEYRVTNRGGKGIINIRNLERNGPVVRMMEVKDGDDIIVLTAEGMAVRSPVDQVSVIGRHTQGVRIVSLKEGDRVVSFAKVALEETEGDTAAGVPVEPPPLVPEGADEDEPGDEPEPEEETLDEGEEPAEDGGEPRP